MLKTLFAPWLAAFLVIGCSSDASDTRADGSTPDASVHDAARTDIADDTLADALDGELPSKDVADEPTDDGSDAAADVSTETLTDVTPDAVTSRDPVYATEPVLARHVMVADGIVFVTARDGTLWAWGSNMEGVMQPADEFVHVEFRSRPQRIDGVRDVREVQSRGGAGHCVIAGPEDRGELYCWGRGAYNRYGTFWSDSWDQWRYPHRMGPYSDIRSFTQYGTVIRADNTEWAWDGHAGELWTRSELSVGSVMKMGGGAVWVREGLRRSESFARFYAAGVFTIPGIVDFAAGDEHSCALTSGGRVFCWGRNEAGQAGNFDLGGRCGVPDVMDRGNCVRTPTPIPGIDDAVAITADPYRGCVIRRDRTVWCWGSNGSLTPGGPGTLGDGLPPRETCGRDFFGDTWDCARRPVQVVGLRDAVEVSTGGSGPICAVVSSGQVYCWGSGGAYIDGTTEERTTPTLVRW